MLWRLAARLVTGPAAFALALIVDLLLYALHSAGARVNHRW